MKTISVLAVAIALFALVPVSATAPLAATDSARRHAPPGGAFKPVSGLVPLPDFIPGLGALYVDPATLPAGPFLAYDRAGGLVGSVYMIPVSDLRPEAPKDFPELAAGRKKVDHVSLHFNAGHPGVTVPHYHFIVWYISPEQVAGLK